MSDTDGKLAAMLRSDAFSEAERITGKSYKTDAITESIGVWLQMRKSEQNERALRDADDTVFVSTVDDYLRIAEKEGFSVVLKDDFTTGRGADSLYILWHDDGILLVFDTYGKHVNGGRFYYNIALRPGKIPHDALSSGGVVFTGEDGTRLWSGYHDCREALRLHLRRLRSVGSFLREWSGVPFLWLKHHGEKERDYSTANAERIARLPERVRNAIRVPHA